jgi:DNA-binding NtrC family response regulator
VAVSKNLNGRLYRIVEELVRQGVTLDQARREFEKQYIVSTLRSNAGNFSRSARDLGVHRNTLRNKLGSLGIETGEYAAGRRSQRRRNH